MTIDERISDAAREARAVTARVVAPEAAALRRAARLRRAPAIVLAAAVVVALVVGAGALLRGDGEVVPSTTPAPVATEPDVTASSVATPPIATIELPITDPDPAATRRALEEVADLNFDLAAVGMVGDTVLLVGGNGTDVCVAAVGPPEDTLSPRTQCGLPVSPQPSLTPIFDGDEVRFVGEVLVAASPGVARLEVTAGTATYAQELRDGFGYVRFPVPVDGEVLVETFAADGRRLLRVSSAPQVDMLLSLLELRVVGDAARMAAAGGDLAEIAAVEQRLAAIEAAFAELTAAPGDIETRLTAAQAMLEVLRAEAMVAERLEPGDGLGTRQMTLAAAPDGALWVAGGIAIDGDEPVVNPLQRRDPPEESHGEVVTELPVPMRHLAAGTDFTWFAGPTPSVEPSTLVGFHGRDAGTAQSIAVDVADLVLADESGITAYAVSATPARPVVYEFLASGKEPVAYAVGLPAVGLSSGLAWEGGLLVGDRTGLVWQVDIAAGRAVEFAEVGPAAVVDLAGAPGGRVYAVVDNDIGTTVVVLDDEGNVVGSRVLEEEIAGVVAADGGDEAFALAMTGEIWRITADSTTLLDRIDPGDTPFTGVALIGTTLWLEGGHFGTAGYDLSG